MSDPNQAQYDEVGGQDSARIILPTRLIPVQLFSEALQLMEEAVTFILVKELHACICSTTLRKQKSSTLICWASMGALASLFTAGLQELLWFVPSPWWQFLLAVSMPFALAFSFMVSAAVLYYGINAILALKKSDDFRAGNASKSGRSGFLINLLIIILISQNVKLVIRFARLVSTAVLIKSNDNHVAKLVRMAFDEGEYGLFDFMGTMKNIQLSFSFINTSIPRVCEFAAIFVAILFRKNIVRNESVSVCSVSMPSCLSV